MILEMSEHTTNSGGLVNHVVSPTTYFHSLSSNQMNGLATDLSDLAIGDRPPPRKIRRRNALTVQDLHFPYIVPPLQIGNEISRNFYYEKKL